MATIGEQQTNDYSPQSFRQEGFCSGIPTQKLLSYDAN